MKITLFLLCLCFLSSLQAQDTGKSANRQKDIQLIPGEHLISQDTSAQVDTLQKSRSVSELFFIGQNAYKPGKSSSKKNGSSFKGHWQGFNFGFVNFAHLPHACQDLELDWGGSFALQFKLWRYDIRLSRQNNFGLVTGVGLEYQRLRFNNDNVSILKSDGDLHLIRPLEVYPKIQEIKRSTLKELYLTIPLFAEVQFPKNLARSKRMYVSGGIMGGLRMHSKTKIVYNSENGNKHKKKNSGNFNLVPFKADAVARIGYRRVNVWGSYTLTNMFKDNNLPDLHLYTIGLGFTL